MTNLNSEAKPCRRPIRTGEGASTHRLAVSGAKRSASPQAGSVPEAPNARCCLPEEAGSLSVADLPVSSRLRIALKRSGVARLADLQGQEESELRQTCGNSRTFEELKRLIGWAVAGSARLAEAGAPNSQGSNIIDHLDELVSSLSPAEVQVLRLRYGCAEEESLTLDTLGPRSGLCPAVASGMILKAVVRIRHLGGSELEAEVEGVASACLKAARPLTPEVVRSWMRKPLSGFRSGPAFYMRLIAELSHGRVPIWPMRQRHGAG
jgi:hypothetical protein